MLDGMQWTRLTDEERDFWEANGFLIVRNALKTDEIDSLIEAGDRLIASGRKRNRQRVNDEYDGFRNVVSEDEAFRPLLTQSTTVPLVAQIMGPRLQLHTSHLIWKNPDPEGSPSTRRVPGWHRDIGRMTKDIHWETMPRLEIKIAYYLTDCSEPNCGQTMVVPGSHRWREQPEFEGDPEGALEPMLQAGDALLFENRTFHAGGANLSGRTRKTIMYGYSHRWVRPDDYAEQDPVLMERCDPIERGLMDVTSHFRSEDYTFKPGGERTALEELAAEHGCTRAACR